PGNNGGDGFVVARLLKEWGWEVEVFLYGTPEGMPPDARVNYERWMGMGEVSSSMPDGDFDLIVDALFGIGLTRPLEDKLVVAVDELVERTLLSGPNSRTKIVAIDVVSGICADSGRRLGKTAPYFAHLTVTFHRAKLGHYQGDLMNAPWALRLVDIGLVEAEGAVELTRAPGRRLGKKLWGHKFGYGHALILSGPSGHGGAARMTARGALRIGAGLVTLGCSPDALAENATRLDAIMLKVVADGAGLLAVLADTRINVVCLGPGLGVDARGAELVRGALEAPSPSHPSPKREGRHLDRRAVVLDADALTLLARDRGLFGMLHDRCVLTPHGGEFARLFPDIAALLDAPATKGPAYSKVDATREAAARAGCTVLFKGPDTVIASPDGTCAINSAAYDRAAPWLATAGSGDVLAGFITGLLARGFAPQQAAETGAWLHVECARSFGPGLIAEDLPEELPKVFRALGL
ncbi:MAG: NAD(P)H-hydrate dehydratase, partial [Candidatus Saccharibacteria bacterium]|nr:NAD(P)H-hydrate dehydratase [Pseudorhodobacter sp.]